MEVNCETSSLERFCCIYMVLSSVKIYLLALEVCGPHLYLQLSPPMIKINYNFSFTLSFEGLTREKVSNILHLHLYIYKLD